MVSTPLWRPPLTTSIKYKVKIIGVELITLQMDKGDRVRVKELTNIRGIFVILGVCNTIMDRGRRVKNNSKSSGVQTIFTNTLRA